MKRQAGAVVELAAAARHHSLLALQVALLANGVAERHLQPGRVDDAVVGAVRRPRAVPADVQLARPVAALAADRVAPEGRLAVAVDRALDVVSVVAVAEQAPRRDRAAEVLIADLVARRQV